MKKVTKQNYQAALKTIELYRSQLASELGKVEAEVKKIEDNHSKTFYDLKKTDPIGLIYGCDNGKGTRLVNLLWKIVPDEFATRYITSGSYLNDMPISSLKYAKISLHYMRCQQNCGKKLVDYAKKLFDHFKIPYTLH
jgi:hypothetical protein